jgi:hypothetical protein
MAEDGIPEILAEQRLGHQVPGIRGLYVHVSDRMRQELTAALQARWEDALRARAAISPHSPLPLLDELLLPYRPGENTRPAVAPTYPSTHATRPAKTISQISPKSRGDEMQQAERTRAKMPLTWPNSNCLRVGMAGFEPAASCSQSRRANQAAPHPVTPESLYRRPRLPCTSHRPTPRQSAPSLRRVHHRNPVRYVIAHNRRAGVAQW